MEAKLAKDSAAETLEDVQKLIYHTVHQFCRMYRADYEDMLSEAYLCFVRTLKIHTDYMNKNPFDTTKGATFTPYLRTRMWYTMINYHRRKSVLSMAREWDETSTIGGHGFIDLLDEMNDDAKEIIQLIFNAPADLLRMMDARGGKTGSAKSTLKKYLLEQGWDKAKIEDSFGLITSALKG